MQIMAPDVYNRVYGEKDKLNMRNNIIEPVKNMSPQKPK